MTKTIHICSAPQPWPLSIPGLINHWESMIFVISFVSSIDSPLKFDEERATQSLESEATETVQISSIVSLISMFRFHIPSQSWSPGPSLSSARGWPGLAVLGEFLYCVGGWGFIIRLNKVLTRTKNNFYTCIDWQGQECETSILYLCM